MKKKSHSPKPDPLAPQTQTQNILPPPLDPTPFNVTTNKRRTSMLQLSRKEK